MVSFIFVSCEINASPTIEEIRAKGFWLAMYDWQRTAFIGMMQGIPKPAKLQPSVQLGGTNQSVTVNPPAEPKP